jgi:UDP:flavonoid glycosyltransferase YjiC (YdhE family)
MRAMRAMHSMRSMRAMRSMRSSLVPSALHLQPPSRLGRCPYIFAAHLCCVPSTRDGTRHGDPTAAITFEGSPAVTFASVRLLASCSLGGSGHLVPLVRFLDAAAHRGDEVLLAVPPQMEPAAAETGHPYRVCGGPPQHEVAAVRDQLPTLPADEAAVLANRELFGRLCTAAMLPGLEELFGEWRPDLVVRETCEYASAIVARRCGVRSVQVAVSLADVEAASLALAEPALERFAAGTTDHLRGSPYLTRFPESLDRSPFPTTVRYREEVRPSGQPLPNWWRDPDMPPGPLVYATFGTVLGHMDVAASVYRLLLAALASVEARVLLTAGRATDLAALGPTPKNVHVEPWVAQDDVLPQADLVVCHGGSGTLLGSLAASTPVVVVPLFADQLTNGRRVAAAGAGFVVERQGDGEGSRQVPGPQDVPRITSALNTALEDETLRSAASRLAREMGANPGVARLISAHAWDVSGPRA